MHRNMRQSIRYLGAALARVYLLPLYALSGLMPRSPDLWVFGSWGGQRYADNAAAFFEHCERQNDGKRSHVWISHRLDIARELRALGHRAYWWWSPAGAWCCLRASLHLFDCFPKDTNFWLSRGARLVNLWSGVPLKRFERDIDQPGNRYYRLFHGRPWERLLLGLLMPWHVQRPDLVIASSPETRGITARAFDIPQDRVAVTGLPRNDRLFAEDSDEQLPASFSEALAAGRRIVLYLPTFRDSGKPAVSDEWLRLGPRLQAMNASLFIKLHPVDDTPPPRLGEQIHGLPRDLDVYRLLPKVDLLISDYSSIIWDFLLLDRPLLLYVPDKAEFIATSRGLNFDPDELAPGPVCHDFSSLEAALADSLEHSDRFAGRRREVRSRLHSHVDASSCERVLASIRELLASAERKPGCFEQLAYRLRYNSVPRLFVNALKRVGIVILPYYLFKRRISGLARQIDLNGCEFRELSADDMPRLAALPMVHADEATFRARLAAGQRCFGLLDGERVLGFCWMDPQRCSYPGEGFVLQAGEAYAFDVFTVPARRGASLAPLLNACFTERLRAEGVHTVYGVVDSMNEPSLRFTEKIGSRRQRKNLYLKLPGLPGRSFLLRQIESADGERRDLAA